MTILLTPGDGLAQPCARQTDRLPPPGWPASDERRAGYRVLECGGDVPGAPACGFSAASRMQRAQTRPAPSQRWRGASPRAGRGGGAWPQQLRWLAAPPLAAMSKGNFACRAPDGICAPTSRIDDAALALISGERASPRRSYTSPRHAARRMSPIAAREPVRSGEKVLRIVFPAHIDAAGRFRETTAIHAVVERGDWIAAASSATAPRISAVTLVATLQQFAESRNAHLGELAAAAPEVQFPDPVAPIDAQLAAEADARRLRVTRLHLRCRASLLASRRNRPGQQLPPLHKFSRHRTSLPAHPQ